MKRFIVFITCIMAFVHVFSQKNMFVVEDSVTGLKGCMNLKKKIVIPYDYEELEPIGGGYWVSVKRSKVGLIDSLGNVCVSNSYGYGVCVDEENEVLFIEKDGKYGLIDFHEKVLLPFQYDDTYHERKRNLLEVRRNGKYGLIDFKEKREILPCKYDRIKMGVVLMDNGIVRVDNLRQSDLIAVLFDSKWGFVDTKGKTVIPCKYEDTSKLGENGSEQFDPARYFYVYQGGRAPFVKNGKVGLLDEQGNEVVPPLYKHINLTGDNFSIDYPTAITTNEKQILINKNNKVVTKEYDEVEAIDSNFVSYKTNGKYGLIVLPECSILTDAIYDGFRYPNEGYVRFEKNGKYGYLNKTGKEVFECIYDDGYEFYNGYCPIKTNGKWGFLKAHGYHGTYIDCMYDEVSFFDDNGLAIVRKDGKFGCINTMKKVLVPIVFDEIKSSKEGLYKVKQKSLYGYYDRYGKEIIPCKYTKDLCEIEKRIYVADNIRAENRKEGIISQSEELVVKSIELAENDLSASTATNLHFDINGIPCALIRVMIKDSDPKFEGNISGDIKQWGMQYLVYMSAGSKYLRIAPADHFPLMVSFADYGIKALESKKTYDLILLEGVEQ